MKNNKGLIIFLIALLSIISIGIIVFLIIFIKNKSSFDFSFNFGNSVSSNILFDEKYDNDFNLISINSDAANIYVKNTDDEQFKLVVYGEKDTLDVNTNSNELNVDLKSEKCVGFCFNRKISKIEIYVPNYYENKINIDSKYGDVEVGSFPNNVIEIYEQAGDIKVSKALKLYVENSYGDVEVGTVDFSDIKLKSGDLEVGTVNELIAKNNYGDIEVRNINSKFKLINDCGDIEIGNINIDSDSSIENKMGDVKIGLTNDIFIDVDHNLGDVNINTNNKKANITLKIVSKLGDVDIKN